MAHTSTDTKVALRAVRARVRALRREKETGAATAEYAIATLAAVGFAGLLVAILRSDEVRGLLTELVRHALSFAG
jgi:Flp pilus assembly pilin Flp